MVLEYWKSCITSSLTDRIHRSAWKRTAAYKISFTYSPRGWENWTPWNQKMAHNILCAVGLSLFAPAFTPWRASRFAAIHRSFWSVGRRRIPCWHGRVCVSRLSPLCACGRCGSDTDHRKVSGRSSSASCIWTGFHRSHQSGGWAGSREISAVTSSFW